MIKTSRKTLSILFVFGTFLFMSGCLRKERVYEGVYEGLKMREEMVNPAEEPGAETLPDYEKYQREREDLLKDSKTGK